MKRELFLSKATTFISLGSIARNVLGVTHETIKPLPSKKCIFTNYGNQITICSESEKISFSKNKIKCFDIVPITSAGVIFYAATLEFYVEGQSLRYGIVVSPESELAGLRFLADQIGELLELPPIDLTQIS